MIAQYQFTFDSDLQGLSLSGQSNYPGGLIAWQGTDGSPLPGCLEYQWIKGNSVGDIIARTGVLRWTDLGVPPNSTVGFLDAPRLFYKVSGILETTRELPTFFLEFYDPTETVLVAQAYGVALSLVNDGTWHLLSDAQLLIPLAYQPSSAQFIIRLRLMARAFVSQDSLRTARIDTLVLPINYTSLNCPWRASTSFPWIHITSGFTGQGNGVVTYTVDPNYGPARTGTISAAGFGHVVQQAGWPAPVVRKVDLYPSPEDRGQHQFLQVDFPGGYAPGLDLDAAGHMGWIWQDARPRNGYSARVVGTVLQVLDASGAELGQGAPCPTVDVWRIGV